MEPYGGSVVGAVTPELCDVDRTVIHPSYPDEKGCVERCPYQLPRQSFCHRAGDGRPPDPSRQAIRIHELIKQRQPDTFFSLEDQAYTLNNLTQTLANLSPQEALEAVTMVNRDGRTAFIVAAMVGDVPSMQVVWGYIHLTTNASTARDVGGYTALMHAVRFNYTAAVAWLVNSAKATLTASDAQRLEQLMVPTKGLPIGALQPAREYLGRGGLTWSHPNGVDFVNFSGLPGARTAP